MKRHLLSGLFALTLAAAPLASAQIAIRVGPPRPAYERVPPPPPDHRDWAWHRGYQRWDGNRYVWTPGGYFAPPRRGARWVDGRYIRRRDGWVWREGYWR